MLFQIHRVNASNHEFIEFIAQKEFDKDSINMFGSWVRARYSPLKDTTWLICTEKSPGFLWGINEEEN